MNESTLQPSGTIVVVDDNPNNLRVLSAMLQQFGYRVRPALDGGMALSSIRSAPPDLILLDIRMPGMSGYEVCQQLKSDPATAAIPVIFISALHETEDKLAAFRAGGVDYITKPFQMEEVLARVGAHINLFQLQQNLHSMVEARTAELSEALASLRRSRQARTELLEQTIDAIALTIEKRDPYTAGHQSRVAALAVAIAGEMGMEAERLEGLKLAAKVHDIGKLAIPAEILSSPRRLSELEMALIREHAQTGYDILNAIPFPWPVATIIRQHHERMDGSGYPDGSRGETLLPESRILAVADVLEAMSSHRPYRPALGIEKALSEIDRGRGALYDPEVAAAARRLIMEKGYLLP